MFSPCNRKGFRDRTNEGDTHEPSKNGLWISLGPGSAEWEKGKKRGQIEKISLAERLPGALFPFPEYLSADFARLFFFFSPTLIFFTFFPQCGAWSEATFE